MKSTEIRSFAATLLILLAAFAAFAEVTSGFSAVTADGVRRAELERSPRMLPNIALVDQSGQAFDLADYGQRSPMATLVTLIYTRCESICRTSASGQAWLQQAIRSQGLDGRVRLLTLSFDPASDAPAVLNDYARRLGADHRLWRFATVKDPGDLQALLKLFDIVVLPDGLGGFTHNAALFVVDQNGRLARAHDIDRPDLALAELLR